ncbi:MAG: type III-B CRISPR-associated protein Cas10/Cmr2 [Gemmatales bacterium]|nr:MAG: type III-B CRISPR-associated protein Cas10/Cmr2 [Gemmatales bacterium]
MSHLIAISVGPVQEFIAAARRTRDLWFGSYLLSEISKAVAKCLRDDCKCRLVFPNPNSDLSAGSPLNVSNVIIAELEVGDSKQIAQKAQKAAQKRWKEFAEDAWNATIIREGQQSTVIGEDVWKDQVDDVIEFYAAWIPASGDYPSDRRTAMRLLAGRKNCRDFRAALGRAGLPKSSLDGQRETVLYPQSLWQKRFRQRLRIRDGEQLDVIGLVKRLAEGNRPYPSVSRIAADPWVRGNLGKIGEVIKACEELENKKILRRLDTATYPQYADFRYEGSAVYPSRHHELLEETIDPDDRTLELLRSLRDALAKLPEPNPYLAVLVADGDKMGAAISALRSAEANREFSKTLAKFATEAEQIVTAHNGVLVYAGGDDVLAFVPVDKCLHCARQLHDGFGKKLGEYKNKKGEAPTLSVGIAIGHFLENLEDLLEYGRAAEKDAKKPDRNGLAVHLHKRGGAPIQIRSRWESKPDERVFEYAEWLQVDAIPGGFPHELRQLIDLYSTWPADTNRIDALKNDAIRVIKDKQPRGTRSFMPHIEKEIDKLGSIDEYRQLARKLLIARQIAVALKQAGHKPKHDSKGDAA